MARDAVGKRYLAAWLGTLVVAGAGLALALVPGTSRADEPLTVTVTATANPRYTCELDAPPAFTDPAHPDEITNRACGYVDEAGRLRSFDPWIDGQLLHNGDG